MPQSNDMSRSLVCFDQDASLIAVIELSKSSWLIAGTVPGRPTESESDLN
jgi:transposase